MKNIVSLLIFSFLFTNLYAQTNHFYYYKDKKIFLEQVVNKKYIVFESTIDTNELKNLINISDFKIENQGIIDDYPAIQKVSKQDFSKRKWITMYGENLDKENLTGDNRVVYESFFYNTEDGIQVGLSHLFYVQLRNEEDFNKLQLLAEENNVQIIGNNEFMPLWYTLSCTKASAGNALEMANAFYETKYFAASEPDLMTTYLPTCTNDDHFDDQWGLYNTGQYGGTGIDINFCQARQITTGDTSVTIAVLDHGFELNHPDFVAPNVLSGYDTETDSTPSQVHGPHGTACAGIIGADSNNDEGISGIAPGCRLMSISNQLKKGPNTSQELANGFNFAWKNGASVISNSWRGGDLYSTMLDNAIDSALTFGRNGLGTVVVFAVGNENNSSVSYPASSWDDVIAVGALNPCGERKDKDTTFCDKENWGSNYGTKLDIMAPGVLVPTTDRQGNNGYNPDTVLHTGHLVTNDYTDKDYTVWFNGTSAACPHVAAVAGLILSLNPYLTQSQVGDVIESTAQKVGGYNYQTTSGRPNGTWHNEMGYGLVDAYDAVQACPTNYFKNRTVTTNTSIDVCKVHVEDVDVQNNSTLTINANDEVVIGEDVEIKYGSVFEIR